MSPDWSLDPEVARRIEALLGDGLDGAERAPGGYSSAERWLVRTRRGRKAFAKVGTSAVAARALRQEAAVYGQLSLACMPRTYGWDGEGDPPVLVLEDLSGCSWPPPWTPEAVDSVLGAIDSIHRSEGAVPRYAAIHDSDEDWWGRIAAEPQRFHALGVVPPEWLDRNADALRSAANTISGTGTSVTHFDLRSDNVCIAPTRAYVIDWSHACLGNARLDLALFLPGLHAEGGPPPETVLRDAPAEASWVAGSYAWYASKPHIPTAPHVRTMQREHFAFALPWAIRALGLEPLQGRSWTRIMRD